MLGLLTQLGCALAIALLVALLRLGDSGDGAAAAARRRHLPDRQQEPHRVDRGGGVDGFSHRPDRRSRRAEAAVAAERFRERVCRMTIAAGHRSGT